MPADFKRCWNAINGNAYVVSAVEVIFTLLISNAAIFIAAFILMLNQTEDISVWAVFTEQLLKFIKPTEIVVFILAIVAPAIWMMLKHVKGWRHLRFWAALLFGQFVVVIISSIVFTTSLVGMAQNKGLTNKSAIGCLLLAILIWYVTLVYQKKVIDVSAAQLRRPTSGGSSGDKILEDLESHNE